MLELQDGIISLRGVYARQILAGTKTVELRRRFPTMAVGSRLWIYEKLPTGAVTAFATVASLDRGTPEALWKRHGSSFGLTLIDFTAYLAGCVEAVAVLLSGVRGITPIAAATIRTIRGHFHPPQIMIKLTLAEGAALRKIAGSGLSVRPIDQMECLSSAQVVLSAAMRSEANQTR